MAGQTLSDVRALLATAGLKPQHRFGQNFLIDLNLMRKLVAAADVRATDVILEVGPGTGSLTECLLATGARVIASEIDNGLADLLRAHFADQPRFTLVEGDALAGKHAIQPELLEALAAADPAAGGARKLVANLPYQIATPLLIDLLHTRPPLASLTVTIQKEVGERLSAAARTDAYGPLAVIAQTLARIRTIAHLPPAAFWPRPQVDSVMVQLVPLADPPVADRAHFTTLVRRAFEQRRKMLRRIVRDWKQPAALDALAAIGLSSDARPEELAPHDWQRWHADLWDRLRSP